LANAHRRDHEGDCLSTSGGGPQLGQPHDQPIHNVTVENLRAENTGDDSIAFFNVASGGVVRNCKISDSFARGILLYNSSTTLLEGNEVERCPVLSRSLLILHSPGTMTTTRSH